jgi:hypothetical protein
MASKPVPVWLAILDIKPENDIVGLPMIPLALAIDNPFVTSIETLVNVVALVLTCRPLPEVTEDSGAPVKFTV